MNPAVIREWCLPIGVAAAVAGIIVWAISTSLDHDPTYGPRIASAFHAGQMVRMEAFGQTGMVVRVRCPFEKFGSVCRYNVRFPAMQLHTNVRLFGADGPIQFAPVALVRGIYEFELRRIP